MGRRKIQIAPITDARNRTVTFQKRKNGLFKKAYELGVLCNSDVAVIIFGHNEKLYEFCSNNIDSVLFRYSHHEGPAHERRGPNDYGSSRDYDGDGGDRDDDSGSDVADDDNIHPSARDLPPQDSLSRGSNVSSQMNGLRQPSHIPQYLSGPPAAAPGTNFPAYPSNLAAYAAGFPHVHSAEYIHHAIQAANLGNQLQQYPQHNYQFGASPAMGSVVGGRNSPQTSASQISHAQAAAAAQQQQQQQQQAQHTTTNNNENGTPASRPSPRGPNNDHHLLAALSSLKNEQPDYVALEAGRHLQALQQQHQRINHPSSAPPQQQPPPTQQHLTAQGQSPVAPQSAPSSSGGPSPGPSGSAAGGPPSRSASAVQRQSLGPNDRQHSKTSISSSPDNQKLDDQQHENSKEQDAVLALASAAVPNQGHGTPGHGMPESNEMPPDQRIPGALGHQPLGTLLTDYLAPYQYNQEFAPTFTWPTVQQNKRPPDGGGPDDSEMKRDHASKRRNVSTDSNSG